MGSFQLGLGDLLLICAPLVLVLQNYKMSRWSFFAAIITFFLLVQVTIYNDLIGVNATITLPLKLVIAGLLYQRLKQVKSVALWQKITFSSLLAIIGLLIFISGFSLFNLELFNRNELISYILAFSAIYLCLIQRQMISDKKLFLTHLVMFLIFSTAVIVAESRQGILVMITIFLCYFFLLIKMKNFLKVILLALSLSVPLTVATVYQFSGEYGQSRINTLQTFEPKTQADNYRLLNALYVINNFQSAPFFGHGNNSFIEDGPFRKVVHNAYLLNSI